MSDLCEQLQSYDAPAKPSEYETFKGGLRQIMSVPKFENDRRRAEWQRVKEQKPLRKQDTKRKDALDGSSGF